MRGSDPRPGAWTTHRGRTVKLFDASLEAGEGRGTSGSVMEFGEDGLRLALDGGALVVRRVMGEGSGKVAAASWVHDQGLHEGDQLGS